ncbi:MAG: RlmE family RNA methyltransferase, partial [Pseudomonadota bacterium]
MKKGGGKKGAGGAKTGTKGSSGRGARELRTRVKTAKGRKISSTRWLDRQLNDPYVQAAKRDGYRGRAAYKLIELDDKLRFLVPGARVVDLGSAPGGWTQVAVKRVNALGEKSGKAIGTVLGVDLQEVEPIAGSVQLHLDFMEDDAEDKVKAALNGPADVVLSDMAASASGHRATDHLRIIALAETAAYFA